MSTDTLSKFIPQVCKLFDIYFIRSLFMPCYFLKSLWTYSTWDVSSLQLCFSYWLDSDTLYLIFRLLTFTSIYLLFLKKKLSWLFQCVPVRDTGLGPWAMISFIFIFYHFEELYIFSSQFLILFWHLFWFSLSL